MKKLLIYTIAILLIITAGCSRESNKDAIKVMTFNVRYDNPAR